MSKKQIPIKYSSRDFNTIKDDLVSYAKTYYPESFKDFNKSSFGALMLDTVAYVGDILSFYLDYQVNESFLDTAVEYNNVIRIGKQLGYNYESSPSSYGGVVFYILIPANANGIGVDSDYMPVLRRGSTFTSTGGNIFTLLEDVNFSDEKNDIIAAKFNESTSLTTHYALKAGGQVVSGHFDRETAIIEEHVPFRKVTLTNPSIAEIVSVTDENGREWTEVNELSQDTIYIPINNTNEDKTKTPFILKAVAVPRRFTVVKEYGATILQFGYGSENQLTPEISAIQDPSQVILKIHGRNYITDDSFDPTNLLSTDKMGISPVNTTLTIRYRVNTAENVNAAANTLGGNKNARLEFPSVFDGASLSGTKINDVIQSLEANNEEPILGDITTPSVEQIKQRIKSTFSAQGRAVTLEDYSSLVYRMPPQFGAIKKCHVVRDVDSFKRNLNLYILSEDSNDYLVKANDTLKQNLKTWVGRYKMINDTIDILDVEIVNIGIEFEIVSIAASNKFDVLENATRILRSRIRQQVLSIGEAFSITDIYSTLNRTPGVADTVNVKIVKKDDSEYSQIGFSVDQFTSPDGRYIAIPQNAIFEVKFPEVDIKGSVK
tara:strand:+ start:1026 stop:2837 length:1812 start_codon:yes stop_codon:yes gene_type:complete